MNVDQRQAAVDPQTKPPDLGYESACFRQLASTATINDGAMMPASTEKQT